MKRVRLVIICGVILSLCVWCICRWDVWFGNPDEDAYVPENVPTRILLTFGDENELSRNVSWSCGTTVQPSYLELVNQNTHQKERIDAVGEVFASRGGKAAYYVAKLRHLKAGHSYRYRVCTGEKCSRWYDFQIQQANDSSASFIYVGDIQDTIAGIANQLLTNAFRHNPDAVFLVCGGDLTERPMDVYWKETFACLDSIGQTMPVLTITGNHDYLKGVFSTLEKRFSLIHSYFLDAKIEENHVFTVRYHDIQLFALDSNREWFYLLSQRKWLEEQLKVSSAKWKIVLIHHPLYSVKGSTNNLIQRWMFDSIIKDYHVDLVLQGHEHAYARMTNHDENDIPTTPVYTISHCSPKNYRIEFNEMFDKFGSGSRYYQKIRTNGEGDSLFLTTVDACTQMLYDSLIIVKKENAVRIVDKGKDIPEHIHFTPSSGSTKDEDFAKRIKEYKLKRRTKTTKI